MNIELMEHLELKGKERHVTTATIELNLDCLEGLSEHDKDIFLKFYNDQLKLANRITESCLNKFLYKLRHPHDFK